jgi:dTDP-glucose pyrophosphorylase
MVDGAKHFFRTMKERDKEFVPLCATWLNRGAYEDLAEAERTLNERIAQRQQQGNVVPMNVVLPKTHFQNRA